MTACVVDCLPNCIFFWGAVGNVQISSLSFYSAAAISFFMTEMSDFYSAHAGGAIYTLQLSESWLCIATFVPELVQYQI